MRLRAISSSIVILLLVGCAGGLGGGGLTQETQPSQASSLIPEQARIGSCLRTQRDLTRYWHLRYYWCGNDLRRDALQAHNVKLLTGNITIDKDAVIAAVRLSHREDTAKQSLTSTSGDIDSNMVRYRTANDATGTDTILDTQSEQSVSKEPPSKQIAFPHKAYVNFTPTLEEFDEEGSRQARSLIPIAHEAARITLLGLYEDDELSKVSPGPDPEERFSVGRSMSVRELWRAEGVDVSKVLIMHHRENRPGHHVEVKFYD